MHVLLTNDDGAPHETASPYIKFLVEAIQKYTNWDLTICVPASQKSWIGKAHLAGKDISASYIYSAIDQPADSSFHGPFSHPNADFSKDPNMKEWCLLDGTPATCADIGINHIAEKPVDLVISGPNVGRNCSALYSLSSGTIGGAMEGVQHGKRAVAVSYAFEADSFNDPKILTEASLISVKLIEKLLSAWDDRVDLYTVNVPLKKDLKLGKTRCVMAPTLDNKWMKSLYTAKSESPDQPASDIVDQSVTHGKIFKWTPDFDSVHKNLGDESVLNDIRAVEQGLISVTALKAAFKEIDDLNTGELIIE
ncbi:hypothetical protein KL942_002880 [Ogataea angusta]|uniref:Survival protein SurE-like phosphatase/nucleotidase domain-containing protein n=1 Tax=Pichia angusta TaxID=870730 RepID=A0AAN6DEF0_PICAN|nr:uncharacterized protein KL928_003262 [Ogataea angusta]KAG7818261.1 hypothetical protein KL928_003262 [Ogataea angusta]KAG7824713.1 hypothetical protein KL909_001935 [Ogataea angusta]KAG7840081.1 hypothetical protein KL942_002880 [Ogataea angusta]KAG7844165.1 hypothetical protein KL941_004114 [Ogataea angusta]KAG7847410.1 hypothetical protein KL940_003746 [Ogataea angusta]